MRRNAIHTAIAFGLFFYSGTAGAVPVSSFLERKSTMKVDAEKKVPRATAGTQENRQPDDTTDAGKVQARRSRPRRKTSVEEHILEGLDLEVPLYEGPDGPHWQSPMWPFIRHARSHPDLWELTGQDAFKVIEAVIGPADDWCGRFGYEDFVGGEWAEEDFIDTWDRVRINSDGFLSTVVSLTLERLLDLGKDHRSRHYARFVTFVGWMQVTRGNAPIAIPCARVAEKLFGSERRKMNVSRYIRQAADDGFLKRVSFGAPHTHRADEYWFDVSRFAELSERASPGTAASFAAAKRIERRLGRTGKA